MRLKKRDLRAPVKGDLDITFSEERISAHAGLEVSGRYLRSLDLARRLRPALATYGLDGDYGVVGRVFALVALIVIGGRRISHLGFLSTDPIVLRFAGLRRLPTDRSLAQWLKRFSDRARRPASKSFQFVLQIDFELDNAC